MARYVFFPASVSDAKSLAAAKKIAREQGATVVWVIEGAMLLEASPIKAAKVAKALPGWQYAVETKTTRVPERTPLERARMIAGKT